MTMNKAEARRTIESLNAVGSPVEPPYDPLKVEKTDHPDFVGGVVWADCELDWIRAYGTRCYNHGNAKGMEAGRLLFEEPKVGAGEAAIVTKEMIGAAHDVMLAKGDFVLSARLLERVYLAMDAKRHNGLK
jgi:hypothetical protein